MEWLLNQGVSTVLLFLILAFMGHAVLYQIPLHLQTIQQGYKTIEESNDKQLERILKAQDVRLQQVIDAFEKALDRIDGHKPLNAQGLDNADPHTERVSLVRPHPGVRSSLSSDHRHPHGHGERSRLG